MRGVFMSRTEKSTMDKKLVGAQIPKDDANRLALLSLELGIPRTAIFVDLINGYLESKGSLSDMIENAGKRAAQAWLNEKSEKSLTNVKAFIRELMIDLKTHRIEQEIIMSIIGKFKEHI